MSESAESISEAFGTCLLSDSEPLLLQMGPEDTKGVQGQGGCSHEKSLEGLPQMLKDCFSLDGWGPVLLVFVFCRFSTMNTCCLL